MYVSGLTYTDKLWFVCIVCRTDFVEHFDRILFNHSVKHILDFVRAGPLMRDDERVKTHLMHKLEPSHVNLYERRSAPLACFQKDESYGLPCKAHLFKSCNESSLRTIKTEVYIISTAFVLDIHIESRPEWEVVLYANANELLYNLLLVVATE